MQTPDTGSCDKSAYHRKRWPDVLCFLDATVIEETVTLIVITGMLAERTTMYAGYQAMDDER